MGKRVLVVGIFSCIFSFITAQRYIADYNVAKESVLRSIPEDFINKARQTFNIAYWHTSHGTHVYYGLCGLQEYKTGDLELFGLTNNNPTNDKLAFHDIYGYDLSADETTFSSITEEYLDDPENADINVVIWSWCDIAGHDVSGNYLPGMQQLIDEYGEGGTRIGTGEGQRENVVDFIFMTGHANANNNIGTGKPKDQADLITDFCNINGLFCLDYYSIDSHDMDDNYWNDAGDDGNSELYGGTGLFYQDYQDDCDLGESYFENKKSPLGDVTYGAHNSQHITANRKAYAMWWILARLAGWDGEGSSSTDDIEENSVDNIYFIADSKTLVVNEENLSGGGNLSVYNLSGQMVLKKEIFNNEVSLQSLSAGIYVVLLEKGIVQKAIKIVMR